jgi:hypothetical protein
VDNRDVGFDAAAFGFPGTDGLTQRPDSDQSGSRIRIDNRLGQIKGDAIVPKRTQGKIPALNIFLHNGHRHTLIPINIHLETPCSGGFRFGLHLSFNIPAGSFGMNNQMPGGLVGKAFDPVFGFRDQPDRGFQNPVGYPQSDNLFRFGFGFNDNVTAGIHRIAQKSILTFTHLRYTDISAIKRAVEERRGTGR